MKVYLSRLLLSPRSRQVRSELAFPYEMHRTIMHAFDEHFEDGEKETRQKAGVLFRADVDQRTSAITLYVQSTLQPDWSHLSTDIGYLLGEDNRPNPACREISKILASLRRGQIVSFRLRANPTKRLSRSAEVSDPLAGKRVGLLREEEQLDWLRRKGQAGGFAVPELGVDGTQTGTPQVSITHVGSQTGRKREDGVPHRMTHRAVVFDGVLRITDDETFCDTLVRGIGGGKAYGFGLLSIAPPGAR